MNLLKNVQTRIRRLEIGINLREDEAKQCSERMIDNSPSIYWWELKPWFPKEVPKETIEDWSLMQTCAFHSSLTGLLRLYVSISPRNEFMSYFHKSLAGQCHLNSLKLMLLRTGGLTQINFIEIITILMCEICAISGS